MDCFPFYKLVQLTTHFPKDFAVRASQYPKFLADFSVSISARHRLQQRITIEYLPSRDMKLHTTEYISRTSSIHP